MPAHIGQVAVPRRSPSFLTIRRAVRGFCSDCVVGLSGGADSLALAAALAAENVAAEAIVVDHGLQPGSADVAAQARAKAQRLGVPARVIAVEVGSAGGMEAAARDARYEALLAAAQGRPVLVGHTLDDQAETVLLGLVRGSGAKSLAGMRPWTDLPGGTIGRPLLGVRRADTESACQELGLNVWHDPQNTDAAFTRVRMRHELLPLLEDIAGGGAVAALGRTAELLRADDDALEAAAAEVLAGGGAGASAGLAMGLAVADLAPLPEAVRTRVLRQWLLSQGTGPLTFRHLTEVSRLVTDWHGQGPVAVPYHHDCGVQMARKGNRLVVARKAGILGLYIQEETGRIRQAGGGIPNA